MKTGPPGLEAGAFSRARRFKVGLWRISWPLGVLAGIALAALKIPKERLSGPRLVDALSSLAQSANAFLTSDIGLVLLGFVAGSALGWVAAARWLGYRFRSRSLLLLDARRADMSFVECIEHVRARSGSPPPGVKQAATSIMEAAARGRLSLWQHSGANVLRRVSPRQIRQAGPRLAIFAGTTGSQDSPGGVEFRLFRNEVEALWPARRQPTIGNASASAGVPD